MSRPKGTPNYKTKALLPLIEQLKEQRFDVLEELLRCYNQMKKPEEKATVLLQLMSFVYPKKRSIEVSERPSKETLAEWVREYLNEESDRSVIPAIPGYISDDKQDKPV